MRALFASCLAVVLVVAGVPIALRPTAMAASCVRISGGNFDAPGNDNYAQYLNGEYVRIRNGCGTARVFTGWKLHDYQRKHTFSFPSGFRLAAGATVTVYTGSGSRTATRLYWNRTYGAVWNNDPPERAYLRNASGTLVSSWSEY